MSQTFDEARLTAFALGEPLSADEQRAMKRQLESSAEARAAVDEIRALGMDLRAAYVTERASVPADHDMDRIVEFSRPRSIPARVPWRTHVQRIAAMVALSAGVLAVGLIYWAGLAGRPTTARVAAPGLPHETEGDATERMEFVMGEAPLRADGTHRSGYAVVADAIRAGHLPPRGVVRVRELVNHFTYRAPDSAAASEGPVAVELEIAAAPWQPLHRLARVHWKSSRETSAEIAFNPFFVAAYRRMGGEPGEKSAEMPRVGSRAGQAATELFEIVPAGAGRAALDGLDETWVRVVNPERADRNVTDLLVAKFEAREAGSGEVAARSFPLRDDGKSFERASAEFQFAVAVAAFGRLLREAPANDGITPELVTAWAQAGLSEDHESQRAEFIQVVHAATPLLNARAGSS